MNGARPHCVSCGRVGHTSWDRRCPVFQHKCDELNEQLEDNKLPYFPTVEGWTQVCEPPKVIYVMPPPLCAVQPPPRDPDRVGAQPRAGCSGKAQAPCKKGHQCHPRVVFPRLDSTRLRLEESRLRLDSDL